jgi:hypothetical protein
MIDSLRENWTLKPLEYLPKIPPDLLQGFQDWNHLPNKFDGVLTGDRIAYRGDHEIRTAVFTKYEIPAEVISWIDQNIADEYSDIGVTFTQGGMEHVPHTDLYREYALNYVLQQGGDEVITTFYSDGVEPLRKPHGTQPQDLNILIGIDSMTIPCQTWTLLDSRVIHGVKNLTSTRIMIGISFQTFPDHLFDTRFFIKDRV